LSDAHSKAAFGVGDFAERRAVRLAGKNVPDGDAELVGIDAGFLYLRTERRIVTDSPVTISFEQTQLSGYVSECQPTEDAWVVTIALASGKRREARIPTGEQFTAGIVTANGTTQCLATVIDKSASGMGLRFPRHVAPGTRIYVEMDSVIVFGEVRHCSETTDGQFIAGVLIAEFRPDTRGRNKIEEVIDKVRWKLTSGIRGKSTPTGWPSA
jgi:hypothetical protein